jgi:exodeoxyribonuclease VII small subunit
MSDSATPAIPFEKALTGLEEVVKALEVGDLALDQAVSLFERGMELATACRQQLDEAQTRIEILTEKGRGAMVPQPFEP